MNEINDLSISAGNGGIFTNAPLGLPPMLWWLFAIAVVCGIIKFISTKNAWVQERLQEPSTHVSVSAFFGFGGLFLDSLYLDPVPASQSLLLAACFFAFLSLIGKDREGPLL